MEAEEILAKIKLIRNDLCNNLTKFCESLDDITCTRSTISTKHLEDNQRGSLKFLYDQIQLSVQGSIDKARILLEKHHQVIEEKNQEVKLLSAKVKKSRNELEEKEAIRKKMHKSSETYAEKLQKLQSLRSIIKSYKLLTATHFAYKKGATMGYIKMNNSTNFEVFDFSNSQMNSSDITKKMFTLLEKVSTEDYKNRQEHINNNNKKTILS